ncbi:MAG TPA: rod shape-determining protein MreD [Symbiobacteriaceae bacterium]|nr:rod shape-determining protein MreD [Symbiobacteriaceae bacterium]
MRYWVLTGVLILAFLLQSVVSSYLAIGGITPDFLLAVVVTYGLLFGWEVGLVGGVVGGLLIDLIAGRFIGLHVLSYGLVGLVAGLAEARVFKDNILLAPVGGLAGSIVSQTITVLCFWLYGLEVAPLGVLRSTILPAALYDMILTILVYGRIYRYYLYLRPDPRGTIVIRRH